jgi:hypothetical protein
VIVRLSRRQVLAGAAALAVPRGALASNWLQQQVIKQVARHYGRFPGEGDEFRAALWVYGQVLPPEVRSAVCATDPVGQAVRALAELVAAPGVPQADPYLGAEIASAPLFNGGTGRLFEQKLADHPNVVVFSDHHLGPRLHRHNVFSGVGGAHFRYSNHGLYQAVLQQYLDAGEPWTLVENGDVEDLVVFDPRLRPGEFAHRRRLMKDQPSPSDDPFEASRHYAGLLDGVRPEFRRGLLVDILSDPENRAYYGLLRSFQERGRLFRLAGNHDWPRDGFWDGAADRARAMVGELRLPDAAVHGGMLTLVDGSAARRVVFHHGHAFDHSSSPLQANVHGETMSEHLGIWYQGADRIWGWDEWGSRWAAGRPFPNRLTGGEPPTEAELLQSTRDHEPFGWVDWVQTRKELWGRFAFGTRTVEDLFEHPIAWEYLARDSDKADATDLVLIARAATSGDGWFKFRHTEEVRLVDELQAALGRTPPTLVLGHTHEARCGALDRYGVPATWYANAGAVGRFEGILWGVELRDGEPRIVSWHPDPFPNGPPVRRVWSAGGPLREVLTSRQEAL